MALSLPLLVFSDLDGTLLSHDGYDWTPAQPALTALARIGAGVVLATSKTAAEVAPLRACMGLQNWPAIVENGAGLLPAGDTGHGDDAAYRRIRATLRELHAPFLGFGDMSTDEVVRHTGLPPDEAALARARQFSEPGLWQGDARSLERFLADLAAAGITARRGGRFLTLSFGATKADRMGTLIDRFAPRHTIALGDAPNDIEMLETADFGVIIHNPHSTPLPELDGEAEGRITRSSAAGPEGWNSALRRLIKDLNLAGEPAENG